MKKNWFAGFLNDQQYLSIFWFITILLPSKVRVLNLFFPTIGPVGWGVSVGIVSIKATTISMMIKPRNVARRDCPGTSWHLQLSILLPATRLKHSIFCCCVRDSTLETKTRVIGSNYCVTGVQSYLAKNMAIKVLCYLCSYFHQVSHGRNKWFEFVDHRFFKVAGTNSLPVCCQSFRWSLP